MSWIPVPKKTYWPPPVMTSTVINCVKQESTASLSGELDNEKKEKKVKFQFFMQGINIEEKKMWEYVLLP